MNRHARHLIGLIALIAAVDPAWRQDRAGAAAEARFSETYRSSPLGPAVPSEPETIPAYWIDLPEAPWVARIVIEMFSLVNRSDKTLLSIEIGCVVEDEGKVRIVTPWYRLDTFHVGWVPGQAIPNPLRAMGNLDDFAKRNRIPPCPAEGRFAVIGARATDDSRWSAAGTPWPR
jgi:hypothetical protein